VARPGPVPPVRHGQGQGGTEKRSVQRLVDVVTGGPARACRLAATRGYPSGVGVGAHRGAHRVAQRVPGNARRRAGTQRHITTRQRPVNALGSRARWRSSSQHTIRTTLCALSRPLSKMMATNHLAELRSSHRYRLGCGRHGVLVHREVDAVTATKRTLGWVEEINYPKVGFCACTRLLSPVLLPPPASRSKAQVLISRRASACARPRA